MNGHLALIVRRWSLTRCQALVRWVSDIAAVLSQIDAGMANRKEAQKRPTRAGYGVVIERVSRLLHRLLDLQKGSLSPGTVACSIGIASAAKCDTAVR